MAHLDRPRQIVPSFDYMTSHLDKDGVEDGVERILYAKWEVARMTGLSTRTIERMIQRKELDFIRPGGTKLVRIPRAEVDRLAAGKGAK